MSERALQRIAANKKTKAPFLDLGNSGLKNYLPEELADCIWLKSLNLGYYYLDEANKTIITSSLGADNRFQGKELSVLEKFTGLQALYLSNNQIKDIRFLEKMTGLQSLNLSDNQISDYSFLEKLTGLQTLGLSSNQISDCSFLEKLTGLQSLDLSSNQITDYSFLENLTGLQSLDLRSNQITDYSFLENLTGLQSLDLSFNQITDIRFLEKLTGLHSLVLRENQITDIRFLENLTGLQSLELSNNQISDILFLENLTGLQTLILGYNQISDIRFLEKLTGLQTLNLSKNQISDIRFLEKLTGLQTLDLSENQISDIKALLPLLKNGLEVSLRPFGRQITLFNNPITNPPLEIVNQGRGAVIEYFEGKRKPLNECKLIFVGDGGVGKTSLMRRVVYDKFDKNEITTHGINKIAWEEITTLDNKKIKVNLWDFGGQHIQHSLHQFFFTKRVIYVLVLDPRNDLKANYWLDQIEKLGCDSEVLVVYNWKEAKDKQGEFLSNFYELRKKYPKLPDPFVLSCETGEGIDVFKK